MDYLIEIGTEELPAGTTGEIANNFQTLFVNKLSEFGLLTQSSKQDSINIQLFSTPRRIALLVSGLPAQTEAKEELVKGPAPTAPAQAIEGFAKKNQIAKEELEVIEGRLCFKKKIQPIKIQEVLQQSLEHATSSLSGEKWMTWAEGEFNFSRPVRWLVSLLDSEIFPIKLFGLTADRKTRVNRLLEAESQNNVKFVEIDSAQNYVQILRSDKCLVEPLREERKRRILQEIDEIKKREKFNVGVKDELVEEVIDLLEWPTALVGEFEEEFLKLPGFLIATVLSHHQRYFYCFNLELDPIGDPDFALSTGTEANISNKFIFIAQCKPEAQQTVINGNERVLRARLKDAEFFVQEDLKVPLIERKEKLKKMTFQKELGEGKSTMFDKATRIEKISINLGNLFSLNEADRIILKNAAQLAKCDLASSIVFEFPELQGLAGGFIFYKQGGDKYSAEGVSQQYMPSGYNKPLPQTKIGIILSLADKADNYITVLKTKRMPTGSSDPFAIRRCTLGIQQMLLDYKFSYDELYKIAFQAFVDDNSQISTKEQNTDLSKNSTPASFGGNHGSDRPFLSNCVPLSASPYTTSSYSSVFEDFFFKQPYNNVGGTASTYFSERLVSIFEDKHDLHPELVKSFIRENKPYIPLYIKELSESFLRNEINILDSLKSIRRICRILKDWTPQSSVYELLSNHILEHELFKKMNFWETSVLNIDKDPLLDPTSKIEKKWKSLTELQKPIDEFFEGVMVEDPNPEIAHNRKALLYSLKQKLDEVFFAPDWDKLVQYVEEKTKS